MPELSSYAPIVGDTTLDELRLIASKLRGKSILNINSTAVGGGVAEILSRMLPLLKQLGVDAKWDVIKGDERFFGITKNMHNALHGTPVEFSKNDFEYFKEVNEANLKELNPRADVLFVHDPQPIGLVEHRNNSKRCKFAWRCHIDFTNPQQDVMDFLKQFIEKYDCAVFSAPAFAHKLDILQVLISPSIDPLADKNRELPDEQVKSITEGYGIDTSRPIVTQISRFDFLKDPLGVIKVFRKVHRYIDCQLVLAGGGATDDPEGAKVLDEVREAANNDPDIHILLLPPSSDIEINALQRASTVVLQKSLKEGFGLTVSEALWKSKPVIAGSVGGIPLQIKHQFSGILTYSIDGTAYYLKQLLNEPEYARELGVNGREHIKENFLITRHIKDYLLLFLLLFHDKDIIRL